MDPVNYNVFVLSMLAYLAPAFAVCIWKIRSINGKVQKPPWDFDESEIFPIISRMKSGYLGTSTGYQTVYWLIALPVLGFAFYKAANPDMIALILMGAAFILGLFAYIIGLSGVFFLFGVAAWIPVHIVSKWWIALILGLVLIGIGANVTEELNKENFFFSPKIKIWLARLYAYWGDEEGLSEKLPHLSEDSLDKHTKLWLEAGQAFLKDDSAKAVKRLKALPKRKEPECFLFYLLQARGDWDEFERRLKSYTSEQIDSLLEKMPHRPELNQFKFKTKIKRGDWSWFEQNQADFSDQKAIDLLLDTEQSTTRDRFLLPFLYRANRWPDMYKTLETYSLADGLELLVDVLPDEQGTYQAAAQYLSSKGKFKEMRAALKKLPQETRVAIGRELPGGPVKDLILLEQWYKAGNLDEAFDYLSKRNLEESVNLAEKLGSGSFSNRLQGRLFHDKGHWTEAIKCLAPLVKDKKVSADDLRILAECYYHLDDSRKARKMLEKAWSKRAKDAVLLSQLNELSSEMGKPSSLLSNLAVGNFKKFGADILWLLIEHYREFNIDEKARQAAIASVKQWSDPNACMYLGGIFEKNGDFEKAAAIYGRAGETGLVSQGVALVRAGSFEKALTALESADPDGPEKIVIQYHKGFALGRLDRWAEAVDCYEEVDPNREDMGLQSDIAQLQYRMAQGYISDNHLKKAYVQLLEAHQRSDPNHPIHTAINESLAEVSYNLALEVINDPDSGISEAEQYFDTAAQVYTGLWPELEFLRGLANLKERDSESAYQVFGRLAEDKPKNVKFRYHHALAAMAGPDRDYAGQILKKLANADTGNGYNRRAQVLLGSLEIMSGNHQDAEAFIRSALSE